MGGRLGEAEIGLRAGEAEVSLREVTAGGGRAGGGREEGRVAVFVGIS